MDPFKFLGPLAEKGALGIFLAITIAGIILLARELRASYNTRVEDHKTHEKEHIADLKAISEVVNRTSATYEAMARATEDRTRATDAVAAAQAATAAAINHLSDVIKETLDRIEAIDRQQERLTHNALACQQTMERLSARMDDLLRLFHRGP